MSSNETKRIIIHISGASGAGKTTLGNKLIDNFGSKIIVKDLDDLFNAYVQKHKLDKIQIIKYEKYLSNYIRRQNPNKILILVGLNINLLNYRKKISNDYYKINPNPNHTFYIKLPIKTILNARFERTFHIKL